MNGTFSLYGADNLSVRFLGVGSSHACWLEVFCAHEKTSAASYTDRMPGQSSYEILVAKKSVLIRVSAYSESPCCQSIGVQKSRRV